MVSFAAWKASPFLWTWKGLWLGDPARMWKMLLSQGLRLEVEGGEWVNPRVGY